MPQPNILVIMSDQLKATASHLYGNTFCQTPSLQRLANEGVMFRHAFTPHPLCMPARVALWTASYPHQNGSRRNETPISPSRPHAFAHWHQQGYHCGLIGKNHCFYDAENRALFDTWCEIGHGGPASEAPVGISWVRPIDGVLQAHRVRRNMPDVSPVFSYAHTDYPLEDYGTGLIASQTERFLEEHQQDPFALWVSFPDPHEPYEAPRRYADMFPPDAIHLPPWDEGELERAPERNRVLYRLLGMEDEPMEHVNGLLAAYYGMVRFLDDAVGQILDALERLDLRERTIVVFCADHGDFAGEHRMQCKGGVFYDALTRIPLLVSWPGHVPEGVADESMVSLADVVPTLMALQGEEMPGWVQTDPLPTVTDATSRDAAFSEYGCGGPAFTMEDLRDLDMPRGRASLMRSLRWREAEGRRKMARTRQWKYIHDPMGDADELYDLVNDPWELRNVAGDEAHAGVEADMRQRLGDWAIMTEDALPVPQPPEGPLPTPPDAALPERR